MNGYRHEDKYFISAAGYRLLRTRIRAALERGDRRAAEALLGHSLLRDME